MPRVCVPSWSREIAGDACNAFGAGDPPGRELYALRGIYRFGGGLTNTQGVHRSIHQHEDLLLSNLINLSIR